MSDQREDIDNLEEEMIDEAKFLIFQLGTELYGTPLLGVREVLQPIRPKPIPNTVKHFLGLINVRGQILGVVDLRLRFDYEALENTAVASLVFETEAGPIAAIVDRVVAVTKIDDEHLQKKPNIRSQVPIEFLLGATNYQGNLVTLIGPR